MSVRAKFKVVSKTESGGLASFGLGAVAGEPKRPEQKLDEQQPPEQPKQ